MTRTTGINSLRDSGTGERWVHALDATGSDNPLTVAMTSNQAITATAGPGGSISPSGAVIVGYGADQSFTITPDPDYEVADVVVDGSSVGPVTTYTFTDVTADHGIDASFDLLEVNRVSPVPPSDCISTVHPCVTVPVVIDRTEPTPLRAYSVTLALSESLMLCAGTSSITQGSYLSDAGPTSFHVVDNGGGSYTVDCALLGWPCGVTTASGTLFNVEVKNSAGDGTGSVTLTELLMRDCYNASVTGVLGPPAEITIDATPPAAVSNLSSVQVKAGNDADGTTKILLTFTPPADAAAVEVYRAPYGTATINAYPEYDDIVGAGDPAAPAYPPSAPWSLTAVTATNQRDEPGDRGLWYYVVFSKDACENVSAVSNRTGGTLNYHLGDVHDTVADCAGDNLVNTHDVSFLGANYGITLSPSDPLACLDVGPTLDRWVDTRPTTDNRVQFEDLILFALNYGAVAKAAERPAPAARDEIAYEAPQRVIAGELVTVTVKMIGSGRIMGLSLSLSWDDQVVEPVSGAAGELLERNGGIALSPAPGTLDAVVLGSAAGGISGEGILGTVVLRAVATGEPGIGLASVDARDGRNQTVEIGVVPVEPGADAVPRVTELLPCAPNPFNPWTALTFRLRETGPVELSIFGIGGELVRTLVSGPRGAGEHRVVWNGRDDRGEPAASGIYFARLRVNNVTHTRTLTLLK